MNQDDIEEWQLRLKYMSAEIQALKAENARYKDALEFIAGGCLVPPDGGSPCFDDAIEAAKEALGKSL